MNLFVFAMAAVRLRAPQFAWPALALAAVAVVLFNGVGDLRPYPQQRKAGWVGIKDVMEMLRASGFRALGMFMLLALGLTISIELAHLLAPHARLWLQR